MGTMKQARRRAERGAFVLDITNPGWEQEIHLKTLNVVLPGFCPLGQVYGHYDTGLEALNIEDGSHLCRDLGFSTISWVDTYPSYEQLTKAWRRLIKKRRAAARA